MNLGRYISRSASHFRTSTALIFEDRKFTYEELDRRTNRLAQGLSTLGLKRGDRVAIQSWNRPEIVETEVACYKAGLVRIPINARLSAAEAIEILNNAEVKAFITDQKHGEAIISHGGALETLKQFICLDAPMEGKINYEDLLAGSRDDLPDVDVELNDLAVLTYSSGTTGKLKGIMQSYGNRLAMVRKALMFPEVRLKQGDIFIHVGPITHASGMLLMPVMFTGACNVIIRRFDVQMLLETIQRERANYTMLVPAMIHMILAHPGVRQYDLSSLKGIFYGAAPISPAVVEQAIALFGPILSQGYGMSETTSFVSILTASEHLEALKHCPERLSSCGRPVFDTEVRVVDEEGHGREDGRDGGDYRPGARHHAGLLQRPRVDCRNDQKWLDPFQRHGQGGR
jgi:acyl-CoA synthetase (AMP-forming)/AMP-acid ligase II